MSKLLKTIILASGSIYTQGARLESYNLASAYLKLILDFIGITDVKVVLAGGTSAINQGKTILPAFVQPFDEQVTAAASHTV